MKETITIPGYSITRELGKGGMASVYLAVQDGLEREVALKIMSPVLNADPSFAARFKREARIVAQLSHASIVPVFDVGEHQSRCYLSMEYLPGGDLKHRILGGPLNAREASRICIALCEALDFAHRRGYIHRDIKPDNVLFREDGTPVLTDFGIARALDHGQSMTAVGVLVGTPGYMSPEQVTGLDLDGRSDLYSLGVLFHEMLTGTAPFSAETSFSLALKHVSEALPRLPPEYAPYQEFLDRLTAKDRAERYVSGAEVVRALKTINTGHEVQRRVPQEVAPPRAAAPAQKKPVRVPASGSTNSRLWLLVETSAVLTIGVIVFIGIRNASNPITRASARVARVISRIAPPEMRPATITVPDPQTVIAPQESDAVVATAVPGRRMVQRRRERQVEVSRSIEQRVAALRVVQLQTQDARIQQLLNRAKSEYISGAFWEPAGANAAEDYREILVMQPQQIEAIAGSQRVAEVLAAEAVQTESVRDIYTSRLLIDRIKTLQPEQVQLADLEARLEQLLLAPSLPGARERSMLERAAKFISQANATLGRDPLDFQTVDAATEQYDKALAVTPTAPGLPSLKERLVNAYAIVVRMALGNNDPQQAAKLFGAARQRHWWSGELNQLEAGLTRGTITVPVKEADTH